jgi:hypothetical protein
MKLIFENWRKFLNEADTISALPWRQTVPERPGALHDVPTRRLPAKGLKPMDPRDIKTPGGMPQAPTAEEEIPQVKLSGDVLIHNANELFSYFKDDSRTRNIFRKGWNKDRGAPADAAFFEQQAEQFINFMVAENSIFQHDKIVKYLGAGSFGFVVQLDNGHALKIYVGSFIPDSRGTDPTAASDIERYDASSLKTFGGTGTAADLHIYEQGEIETPFGRKWFYAEMPQLIALTDHVRSVHSPPTRKPSKKEMDDLKAKGMSEEDAQIYMKYRASMITRSKKARKITGGLEGEISFLKELAYVSNLVDKHGATAIADSAEAPETKEWVKWRLGAVEEKPEEKPREPIIDMVRCCINIDTHPRGDEPTELRTFVELLEQGDLDTIFDTKKIFLLEKPLAKNLFKQLKEILKTKTLEDIDDIKGANIGVSPQNKNVPIIFDY